MALNYWTAPVSSFHLFGDGGFGSSVMRRRREDVRDVVDLLPEDPFGMDSGSVISVAVASLIEELRLEYHDCMSGLDEQHGDPQGLDSSWRAAYFSPETNSQGPIDCYSSENTAPGHCGYSSHTDEIVYPMSDPIWPAECSSHYAKYAPTWCNGEYSSKYVPEWSDEECYAKYSPEWCGVCCDAHFCREGDSIENHSHAFQSMGPVQVPTEATVAHNVEFSEQVVLHAGGSSSANAGASNTGVSPHDGMMFALQFLEVRDLLSIELACKTLHTAVNDPYMWRCVHISRPLNYQLKDVSLLNLTRRADGNLQCLSLVGCPLVTNEGLKKVLEENPKLTKLCLRNCARLTMDDLLANLKLLDVSNRPAIKHLMIGDIFASSEECYKDLVSLLGIDPEQQHSVPRDPQYFHLMNSSPSCDYEHVTDVELCPQCNCHKLVYDCPLDSCHTKVSDPCRGCKVCIPRCYNCGRCFTGDKYQESFCMESLCSVCFITEGGNGASSSKVSDAPFLSAIPGAHDDPAE